MARIYRYVRGASVFLINANEIKTMVGERRECRFYLVPSLLALVEEERGMQGNN